LSDDSRTGARIEFVATHGSRITDGAAGMLSPCRSSAAAVFVSAGAGYPPASRRRRHRSAKPRRHSPGSRDRGSTWLRRVFGEPSRRWFVGGSSVQRSGNGVRVECGLFSRPGGTPRCLAMDSPDGPVAGRDGGLPHSRIVRGRPGDRSGSATIPFDFRLASALPQARLKGSRSVAGGSFSLPPPVRVSRETFPPKGLT
jgi:hypothetical protein